MRTTLTITSQRDDLGRCSFTLEWIPTAHPWCPECGGRINGPICKKCGTDSTNRTRSQCYYAVPEQHTTKNTQVRSATT